MTVCAQRQRIHNEHAKGQEGRGMSECARHTRDILFESVQRYTQSREWATGATHAPHAQQQHIVHSHRNEHTYARNTFSVRL